MSNILKKYCTTASLVYLLLESFVVFADSQIFTVVDAKCKAQYITKCVTETRANFLDVKKDWHSCPVGYKLEKSSKLVDGNKKRCAVDNITADLTDFKLCADRPKYMLPQDCYRTVDGNKLDLIHTLLISDMRLMLTQFCKSYAQDPSKCEEVMEPIDRK